MKPKIRAVANLLPVLTEVDRSRVDWICGRPPPIAIVRKSLASLPIKPAATSPSLPANPQPTSAGSDTERSPSCERSFLPVLTTTQIRDLSSGRPPVAIRPREPPHPGALQDHVASVECKPPLPRFCPERPSDLQDSDWIGHPLAEHNTRRGRRRRVFRKESSKFVRTLLEGFDHKDLVHIIVRGNPAEEAMKDREHSRMITASRRVEITREAANLHRQRAREVRERMAKERELIEDLSTAQEELMEKVPSEQSRHARCTSSSTTQRATRRLSSLSIHRLFGVGGQMEDGSECGEDIDASQQRKARLASMRQLLERMCGQGTADEKVHLCRKKMKKLRALRILQLKEDEFNRNEEANKQAWRTAFAHVGEIDKKLNAKQLIVALHAFGLRERGQYERQELKRLCNEVAVMEVDLFSFASEAIPRAQKLLLDIREASLVAQFSKHAKGGTINFVNFMALVDRQYFWRLDGTSYATFLASTRRWFDEHETSDNHISERGYIIVRFMVDELVGRLRFNSSREIELKHELSAFDVHTHTEEMLFLFEIYKLYCLPQSNPTMSAEAYHALHSEPIDFDNIWQFAVNALGLNQQDSDYQAFLNKLYISVKGVEGITFPSFLLMIRQLRLWCKHQTRNIVNDCFLALHTDSVGQLTVQQVCMIIGKLGLSTHAAKEHQLIQDRLDDYAQACYDLDENSLHRDQLDELQDFIQDVGTHIAALRHYKEETVGARLQMSPRDLIDFRTVFHALLDDNRSHLGARELREAFTLMTQQPPGTFEKDYIERLVKGVVGGVKFETFLHFVYFIANHSSRTPSNSETASRSPRRRSKTQTEPSSLFREARLKAIELNECDSDAESDPEYGRSKSG